MGCKKNTASFNADETATRHVRIQPLTKTAKIMNDSKLILPIKFSKNLESQRAVKKSSN